MKPKLRHIAITVPDPEKAAQCYIQAFGLKRVGETDWENANGVYRSDGEINIALLHYKTPAAAGDRGRDFFDFRGLVGAFDDARKGNPALTTWALSNALTQYHVSGADDLALGGDLTYLYGLNGTFAGTSFRGAQSIVTSFQSGVQAQGHLIGDPSTDPLKLS